MTSSARPAPAPAATSAVSGRPHRTARAAGATGLGALALAAAGLVLGAAPAAADTCPPGSAPGTVCVSERTDLRGAYQPGTVLDTSYDLFFQGNRDQVAVSGVQITFGFACSANGPVTVTRTATIEDRAVAATSNTGARGTVAVPNSCGGRPVFLRQAGPVRGTVLSSDLAPMAMWFSFSGRGQSSTSIGGGCVAPAALSGVPQLPAGGALSQVGLLAVFAGGAAAAWRWRRGRRSGPAR